MIGKNLSPSKVSHGGMKSNIHSFSRVLKGNIDLEILTAKVEELGMKKLVWIP